MSANVNICTETGSSKNQEKNTRPVPLCEEEEESASTEDRGCRGYRRWDWVEVADLWRAFSPSGPLLSRVGSHKWGGGVPYMYLFKCFWKWVRKGEGWGVWLKVRKFTNSLKKMGQVGFWGMIAPLPHLMRYPNSKLLAKKTHFKLYHNIQHFHSPLNYVSVIRLILLNNTFRKKHFFHRSSFTLVSMSNMPLCMLLPFQAKHFLTLERVKSYTYEVCDVLKSNIKY